MLHHIHCMYMMFFWELQHVLSVTWDHLDLKCSTQGCTLVIAIGSVCCNEPQEGGQRYVWWTAYKLSLVDGLQKY